MLAARKPRIVHIIPILIAISVVGAPAQAPLKSATGGPYIGVGKTLDAAAFFSGLIDDVRIYDRAVKP